MPETYLIHRKGIDWKNHKYVAKEKISELVTRYFYDIKQYRKYIENKGIIKNDTLVDDLKSIDNVKKVNRTYDNKNFKIEFANREKEKSLQATKNFKTIKTKAHAEENNKKEALYRINKYKEESKRIAEESGKLHSRLNLNKAYKADNAREQNRIKLDQKQRKEYEDQHSMKDIFKVNTDNVYKKENGYESSRKTNPGYDKFSKTNDYKINCSKTTLAYELRQRGYDVTAPNKDGDTKKDIEKWYKGGKFVSHADNTTAPEPLLIGGKYNMNDTYFKEQANWFKSEIRKQPMGSHGVLCVNWKNGGSHAVVWERGTNGKITIRDTQIAKSYTNIDKYFEDRILDCSYMRTDNLEFNDEEVIKALK